MLFETVKPLVLIAGLEEHGSILKDSGREEQNEAEENTISAKILEFFINKTKVSSWDEPKSFTIVSLGPKSDDGFTANIYDGSKSGASFKFEWPKKQVPSQISPKYNSSDLYPDGIMSLPWILKYQEKFPAAGVIFHYLYESKDKDPLGANGLSALKRDQDELSSLYISSYKQVLLNRSNADALGLKLIVCFLLKRTLPSYSSVEERINHIRKRCGLEKSNVFSASVVDLQGNFSKLDFLEPIYVSLVDLSSSFFKLKEKKVRKKKGKILAGNMTATTPNALGAPGWIVRYDFKTGFFAELRKDYEGALKAYESAYTTLMEILSNSATGVLLYAIGEIGRVAIEPFSSRWLEARKIVDTVCLKIIKLYSIIVRPVESFFHLQKHIQLVKDFPEYAYQSLSLEPYNQTLMPGLLHLKTPIGGGSFLFWQYVSKQYQYFADIIERATANNFKFSVPFPPLGSISNTSLSLISTVSQISSTWLGSTNATSGGYNTYSSCNPMLTVQHSGFYYLISARAAEESWKRYLHASHSDSSNVPLDSTEMNRINQKAFEYCRASIENGQDFDNGVRIIELLTKSYESFKKSQGVRMTLYLASEIARIYQETGSQETSLKFYERICKTYRKESWDRLLGDMCHKVKKAAWEGKMELAHVCSLVELLHPSLTPSALELHEILNDLNTVLLNATLPTYQVEMTDIHQVFCASFQFQNKDGQVNCSQLFQVVLKAKRSIPSSSLKITKIHVRFSDSNCDFSFINAEAPVKSQYECTNSDRIVGIDFGSHNQYVLQGEIIATKNQLLIAQSIILTFKSQSNLELIFTLKNNSSVQNSWFDFMTETHMPTMEQHCEIRIDQREPMLNVSISFPTNCLCDELNSVSVAITNSEKSSARAFIVLKSYGDQDTKDTDSSSNFFIQGNDSAGSITYDCGVMPPNSTKTFKLELKFGRAGMRSMQCEAVLQVDPEEFQIPKISETHFELSDTRLLRKQLPATKVNAIGLLHISCNYDQYPQLPYHSVGRSGFPADLSLIHDFAKKYSWNVYFLLSQFAEFDILVDKVSIIPNTTHARAKSISWNLPDYHEYPYCLRNTSEIGYLYRLDVEIDNSTNGVSLDPGKVQIAWRSTKNPNRDPNVTVIPLPKLEVPVEPLRILAEIPPNAFVRRPFSIEFHLQNLTLHLAELVVLVEPSDGMSFCGYKQSIIRVLPHAKHVITYNLIPKKCGLLTLPKVRILKRSDAIMANDGIFSIGKDKEAETKAFPVMCSPAHTLPNSTLLHIQVFPAPF